MKVILLNILTCMCARMHLCVEGCFSFWVPIMAVQLGCMALGILFILSRFQALHLHNEQVRLNKPRGCFWL